MSSAKRLPELTIRSIVLAILLVLVMTAANLYLALYAGMTVAAAIPAIVLAVLISRKSSVLEINIIATGASAGEALAGGMAFTIPALIMAKLWQHCDYGVTTLAAISGGILGVLLMIPLRRTFISKAATNRLDYPEGVAAGIVLKAVTGTGRGRGDILVGIAAGGLFKFLLQAKICLKGTVEWFRGGYLGTDVTFALLGVGYIIGPQISFLIFVGGLLTWNLAIPIYARLHGIELNSLDVAAQIYGDYYVRYIGIGMMLVGGVSTLWSIRKDVYTAVRQTITGATGSHQPTIASETDISGRWLFTLSGICLSGMFTLYWWQSGSVVVAVIMLPVMLIIAALFTAVSVYMVGLVGSSNNPASGMIISALVISGMYLFGVGFVLHLPTAQGYQGILTTLLTSAAVCATIATSGDMAQNFRTGEMVQASPKAMQIIQIICVVASGLIIAPVLNWLHGAYVIGEGLDAPQAALFASLAEMIFLPGKQIPWQIILIGVGCGLVCLWIDNVLKARTNGRYRAHVMAVALGAYLPMSVGAVALLGGLVKWLYLRRQQAQAVEGADRGTLLASGLIAGEALMAIALAVPIGLGWKGWPWHQSDLASLAVLAFGMWLIWRWAKKPPLATVQKP